MALSRWFLGEVGPTTYRFVEEAAACSKPADANSSHEPLCPEALRPEALRPALDAEAPTNAPAPCGMHVSTRADESSWAAETDARPSSSALGGAESEQLPTCSSTLPRVLSFSWDFADPLPDPLPDPNVDSNLSIPWGLAQSELALSAPSAGAPSLVNLF